MKLYMKITSIFALGTLLLLGFQNCSGDSFSTASSGQLKGSEDGANIDSFSMDDSVLDDWWVEESPVTPVYHWKCVFELHGQKTYRWKVERHLTFDDNCESATLAVKQNNPNAAILSTTKVFIGYHSDETSDPYHWKCAFTLRGEKGYRWEVERYLKFDDDCVTAEAAVRANNPNATVVSTKDIFVGYHNDGTETPYHWKCAFELRGDRGYRWEVERHLNFDDDCAAAEAAVRANNPKAKISKVEDIFMGYH